jgi:cytochrome c-type biogenesis protein CcmH/NrfG
MSAAQRATELDAIAFAAAQKGSLAQALSLWGEALRLSPDDVSVLVHLGHALAACGERQKAQELAERAARVAPSSSSPWLLLGHLAFEGGDLATALESYALAERMARPDERVDVVVAQARALRRAGQPAEAERLLAAVPRERVDVLLLAGQLAADRGAVDDARAAFVKAGERAPDDPAPFVALARLLSSLNVDRALARELAEHALSLAPHDAETRALLKQLLSP